jgi:hypothetical protein
MLWLLISVWNPVRIQRTTRLPVSGVLSEEPPTKNAIIARLEVPPVIRWFKRFQNSRVDRHGSSL